MDQLVRLFQYPGDGYRELAARCAETLNAPELHEFARLVAPLRTEELQELFIQTFDLNPDCALDIGWHIFGEQYERGEFLVKLRGEMRRFGLAESAELPDHLTHVLPLVVRMEEGEAAEFIASFLLPALDRMIAALEKGVRLLCPVAQDAVNTSRATRGQSGLTPFSGNPFLNLLKALRSLAQPKSPVLLGGSHA